METTIDYLNEVHGDLLDAAARERDRLRAVPGRAPRKRSPSGLVAASIAILVAAGLVGLMVRSNLGSSDEAASEPASSPVPGETGAAGATGATGGAEVPGLLPQGPGNVQVGSPGDGDAGESARIIRTAELSLVIPRDSFDARFAEVVDTAEENGGFVAESTSRKRSGGLTLRVPAESFAETLRALRDLGTVEVESVGGRDVTDDYVDLRARLRIAKSRREVLLGLQADATSIPETIRVQNELDQTQLQIEEIQGELRVLDDRTSFATVHVDLREEGVEPEAEVEPASLPDAFERAAAGFVDVIAAIVIGLGYLIPLGLLGLLVWFVVVRIRRRRAG
jgi:hypothetical protein